ncbi:MAG: YwaF family protein [Lachnospiraceae bacterium]|nr:YwaF family protein [Lachnospiraceae bacterium]
MFARNHLLWIGICLLLIVCAFAWLKKRKPPLRAVLSVYCVLAVLSEFIKVFSSIRMLPVAGESGLYPYLDIGHLPLHLCSMQVLLIFLVRFTGNNKLRDTILAFMYPTCAAGAFFAVLLPSIFPSSMDVSEAFVHPLAYQYFLWHSGLIILGFYIPVSGEISLTPRRLLQSILLLSGMGFGSLYINMIFSRPVYDGGHAVSLEYVTNFFFTAQTPIGIPLLEKGHWILYYLILQFLAILLMTLLYLPFMKKRAGTKTGEGKNLEKA